MPHLVKTSLHEFRDFIPKLCELFAYDKQEHILDWYSFPKRDCHTAVENFRQSMAQCKIHEICLSWI